MDEDLVNYIENNIFPLYEKNDKGHGLEHINNVIKRSLELADNYDINRNIIYAISAYHDLGVNENRDKHEIISAKMFEQDKNMQKYFSDEDRKIIKEAIEDHRASSKKEPRNLYGKIVATADRTVFSSEDIIKRSYYFAKKNYLNKSQDDLINIVYNELNKRYGKNGYVKAYVKVNEFEKSCEEIRNLLLDKKKFVKKIKKIIQGD